MICGNLDNYTPVIAQYVSLSGVPFLGVEYRLSPEYTGTILVEDTYAAVEWLVTV